jgi:ubiquinone/menaquinone biosynthesis C-methylase UbiE
MAESYDALTDSQFDTGVQLIQALGVKRGDTVLDVGCGAGELGFHVLGQIGETGRLIGIDPSEDRSRLDCLIRRHGASFYSCTAQRNRSSCLAFL